ncbi:MAG: MBL fold metallo-hydrolase [Oscillospiraceae bacterium]|jgi:L-ascorbate metabolism protein UlaG (beta-lactamase superfamily)|nr:MBL fold metallo-hydrolase [Oscillospiraceae bacterium]
MQDLVVTYLHHSGFSVALGETLLVFDYAPAEHGVPGSAGVLCATDFAAYSQVVVFVSHSHADHFDPTIFDWAAPGTVHYVLGYDLPARWPGARLHPGDRLSVAGVEIEAYESTDLGVSYLVSLGDYRIFHAGDLNLWHWRDVSTLREIEDAEQAFYSAVRPLEGQQVDLAFFPVDYRLGTLYDAGANYFTMAVKPRVLIPMHWQDRPDIAQEFARKNRSPRVEIIAMTERGACLRVGKRTDHDAQEWYVESMVRSIRSEREAARAETQTDQDEAPPEAPVKRPPTDMHTLAQLYAEEPKDIPPEGDDLV